MSILKAICEKMDMLVNDYFATLDEVYQRRSQMEADMRDGMLLMAKARYSMGNKSITQLQYNEEDLDQAVYHINISCDKEDDATQSPSFHLVNTQDVKQQPEVTDTSHVRKRNIQSPGDLSPGVETLSSEVDGFQVIQKKSAADSTDRKCKDVEDEVSKLPKDTIKWFGVLVPQALRQSQDKFKRAVQHVATIATLQARLLNIKSEFRELHSKKSSILNEVQGDDDDDDHIETSTFSDMSLSPTKEEESFFKTED